ADRALLILEEWQFVYGVSSEAVWPVISRAGAVGAQVERVLRHGHLAGRGVEDLRGRINGRAPGVVHARAESTSQALVQADLQRVVDRGGRVSAQAEDAAGGVDARREDGGLGISDDVGRRTRVAVDRLEQSCALRAHVADAQDYVTRQFALHFQAELIIARRAEVPADYRTGQRSRVQ